MNMPPLDRRLAGRPSADVRHRLLWIMMAILVAALVIGLFSRSAAAQDALQSGEAFVTRFSGTTTQAGRTVIDTAGTVGSIVDLRQPGAAPQGAHWLNEQQRSAVTAAQVGQVFGVALDDASPPNIYLTATSAFGLHRNADNTGWMPGQWGPDGGPGTVWRLNAANNYQPEIFANITLDGRANSGAALGNIAFDRWNRQFYVSDPETGMIHRLRATDGLDLGTFDHGMQGRAAFFDIANRRSNTLPGVTFDPARSARTGDCPSGDFARDPSCWNFADFRRRVWGLGVRSDPASQEVRLYYATWSSQGFGHTDFAGADDDEKRNAVWSVGINADGSFNTTSVRRELFLPDFFRSPEAIARAGLSHPVSDIAFSAFGEQNVMLLAERGGVRNRGLPAEDSFAHPNEARVLRYELTDTGGWREAGRYDVGYYDRGEAGPPYLRAGAAGGVSFGTGYGETGEVDPTLADAYVWMTGDGLCSPRGACFNSGTSAHDDTSEVHGIQGRAARPYEAFEPMNAFEPYPAPGPVMPPTGPDRSYMIDIDADGDPARNDATRIGDVEVFQTAPPEPAEPAPVEEPEITELPPEGWVPAPLPPDGWYPLPPLELDTDLAIEKTGPAQCQEGVNCEYTITVTNVGAAAYIGPVAVRDTMPEGGTLANAPLGWNCVVAGRVVSCITNAHAVIDPGARARLTLAVLLPPDVPGATVRNCAAIDWPEMGTDDGPGDGNDEACIDTPVIEGFNLGLIKVGPDNCVESSECTFGVLAGNFGPGEYNGVVALRDTLPAGTTLVNAIGSSGGGAAFNCVPIGGDDIRCVSPPITVPAGAIDGFLVTIRLPAGNVGGTYENCAQIDWAFMGADDGTPDPHADDGCHTVNVLDGAAFHDLEVTKSGPAHCDAGADCTFDITVTNRGPGDYAGEIVVTDTLVLPGATYVVPIAGWDCFPPGGSLTCRLPGGPHTLHPGDSHTIPITVTIPDPPPSNPMLNIVRLRWGDFGMPADDNPPPGAIVEYPDGAVFPVNIDAGFDFEIAKTALAPTCYEGGLCDFSVDITNHGPAGFFGALPLTDTLPVDATLQSMTSGFVNCPSVVGRNVNCHGLTADIFWPGLTHTITVSTRLADPFAGDRAENCVEINWGAPPPEGFLGVWGSYSSDDNGANDGPVCAASDVLAADLAPFSATQCNLGEACEIEVSLENRGGRLFRGAAGLRGTLSPAVQITRITSEAPGFACRVTGDGAYECSGDQLTIKPGEKNALRLNMVLKIPADFPHRRIEHRKEMVWPDLRVKDKKPINDRHTSAIWIAQPETAQEAVPAPEPDFDLVVKKTGPASCSPGGLCEYTVTVVNAGPGTYRGIVYLFDTYPGYIGSSFVSASGAGWRCFDELGTVECQHDVVELGPRESVTLRITIRLSETIESDMETRAGGGARNCARIDWPGEYMRDERHRNFWVERMLVQEGYLDKRWVDGVIGPQDREAIRRYQSAHREKPTGEITPGLWNAMFPHSGRLAGDANAANDNRCIVTPLTPEIPPARAPIRPALAPDLKVTKIAKQGACVPGKPCGFAVTIANTGAGTYTGPIQLSDVIRPANARLTYSGPSPWACRSRRGRITCTHPETTLAPGASTSFSLTFTTRSSSTGTVENCATLSWSETARVMTVQSTLNRLGFAAGTADGKAGRQTRKAVRAYQESVGLRGTGRIDTTLMRKLFGAWGEGDANAANDRACATATLRAAEIPPAVAPALCTGGRSRNNRGQCVCPSDRPLWTGRACVPVATPRVVPPVQQPCTGGRSRNNRGQCVCPSDRPVWTGQICKPRVTPRVIPPVLLPCTGGRIRNNRGQCVCPSNRPIWTGQVCKPRAVPQTLRCPSGYRPYKDKRQIPTGWTVLRRQSGNRVLFCARPRQQQLTPQRSTPQQTTPRQTPQTLPQLRLIVPPTLKKK